MAFPVPSADQVQLWQQSYFYIQYLALKEIYDQLAAGGGGATETTLLAFKNQNNTNLLNVIAAMQSAADQINRPANATGAVVRTICGRITSPGTIYTVTPGKILRIYSLQGNGVFLAAGYGTFRDGGAAGAIKCITPNSAGVSGNGTVNPQTNPQPLEFTTDVYYAQDTGTLTNMNFNLNGIEI